MALCQYMPCLCGNAPYKCLTKRLQLVKVNRENHAGACTELTYLRNLEEKKASVLASIEEQGKLTEELRAQIEAAQTLVVVAALKNKLFAIIEP